MSNVVTFRDLAYAGMNRSETASNETIAVLAQRLFSVRFGSMLGGRANEIQNKEFLTFYIIYWL